MLYSRILIYQQCAGEKVRVSPGDFVTFPDGFTCFWHVHAEVTKHYYLY